MSRAPVFIRNPEFRLCYAQIVSQDSFAFARWTFRIRLCNPFGQSPKQSNTVRSLQDLQ